MMNLEPIFIREQIIKSIREFFDKKGFHEVVATVLNKSLPVEPNIYPFATVWSKLKASDKLYLSTSPEATLKKMIAMGIGNCFAIGKTFRNLEGQGSHHNPEFLMLEWYRKDADYTDIMRECERLILYITNKLKSKIQNPNIKSNPKSKIRNQNLKNQIIYQNHVVDLSTPWRKYSLIDLFQKYAGLDLEEFCLVEPGQFPGGPTSAKASAGKPASVKNLARFTLRSSSTDEQRRASPSHCFNHIGYTINTSSKIQKRIRNNYNIKGATWESLYNQIFLNEIEPRLSHDPFFLTDFPSRISPLCKPKVSNPLIAERFELYIAGMELGNGNTENTDYKSVQKVFNIESEKRKKSGEVCPPVDKDFLKALEYMKNKSYAGIGLGVDRLAMLMADAGNIKEIEPFCV